MSLAATARPTQPRLWRTPQDVEVALTGACNLSCGYCSYGADKRNQHPDDMTTEQLLALFDELGEMGVMKVTLTGGEPLLRPDFLEIVASVVKNRMRFRINTNGVLLTTAIADALVATRRLDGIQVSIDGAEAAINDKNRSHGAFAGAMAGMRLLAERNVKRTARLTISRFNADHLEQTLDLLLELAPSVGTNEVMPFGRGGKNYSRLAMSAEQRARVTEILVRYEQRYPGRVTASAGPLVNAHAVDSAKAKLASCSHSPAGSAHGHLTSCGGFHTGLAIQHDGSILPCIQIPDMKLGKVGQVSLRDLWLHHENLNELRNRWEVQLESLEYCQGCQYIPVCRGGCPANAISLFGTHLAPDPIHCLRRLIDGVEFDDSKRIVRRGIGGLHLRVLAN